LRFQKQLKSTARGAKLTSLTYEVQRLRVDLSLLEDQFGQMAAIRTTNSLWMHDARELCKQLLPKDKGTWDGA